VKIEDARDSVELAMLNDAAVIKWSNYRCTYVNNNRVDSVVSKKLTLDVCK